MTTERYKYPFIETNDGRGMKVQAPSTKKNHEMFNKLMLEFLLSCEKEFEPPYETNYCI